MTREEAQQALETGISMVEELKNKGYSLIATGEMGIGNTTTSSAVASVLLNEEVEKMTGRGAGLSSEGMTRKTTLSKKRSRSISRTRRTAWTFSQRWAVLI